MLKFILRFLGLLWLFALAFLCAFYQLGRVDPAPLLAYSSSTSYTNADIILADVNAGIRMNLTNSETPNNGLAWSRDGRYLVFRSTRESYWTFFVLDTQSWQTRQLVSFERETILSFVGNTTVAFSENYTWESIILSLETGQEVAAEEELFACLPSNCYYQGSVAYQLELSLLEDAVYVELEEIDWSNPALVNFELIPLWSADGDAFLFRTSLQGQSDIYWSDADGGFARRLTNSQEVEDRLVWSKDERWISFTYIVDGRMEVLVLELATTQIMNISRSARPDFDPVWQP